MTRPRWKDVELKSKVKTVFSAIKELGKESFFGSSPPSVFVGSKLKYPNVNVGILSPPLHTEESWVFDAPHYWSNSETSIKAKRRYRVYKKGGKFRTKP